MAGVIDCLSTALGHHCLPCSIAQLREIAAAQDQGEAAQQGREHLRSAALDTVVRNYGARRTDPHRVTHMCYGGSTLWS